MSLSSWNLNVLLLSLGSESGASIGMRLLGQTKLASTCTVFGRHANGHLFPALLSIHWQSLGVDSLEPGSEWGRSVADVVDEGAMKTLLAGAEAAFKVSTSQSMKFTKVRSASLP